MAAAIEALKAVTGSQSERELSLVTIAGLVECETLEDFLEFAAALPPGPISHEAGRHAGRNFLGWNPELFFDGFEVCRQRLRPDLLNALLIEAGKLTTVENSSARLAWAMKHPTMPALMQQRFVESALVQLAATSPADALRATLAMPDDSFGIPGGGLRAVLVQRLDRRNSPESLLRDHAGLTVQVIESITDGRMRSAAVVSLGQKAGTLADPVGATEKLVGALPADEQTAFRREMFSGWLRRSPNEALEWLVALPSASERDSLLGASIPFIAGQQPDVAGQWAEKISDPQLRRKALEAVAPAPPTDGEGRVSK